MAKILMVFAFFILSFNISYGDNTYYGIGYGKNRDEAKKEALSDLSSSIKVQVYSKHQQESIVANSDLKSLYSSRFIKLVSNLSFINPTIDYFEEKDLIKAVVSINNPEEYIKKLKSLTAKINSLTSFSDNDRSDIVYRSIEKAMPIYIEYENYEHIIIFLGYKEYPKPRLSSVEARKKLIEIGQTPPSLEIAAEILSKPMLAKSNIYVAYPVYAGSQEVTPFSMMFKEILDGKVKSNKNKDSASYTMACFYVTPNSDVVVNCSLISGGSITVASSVVKIPSLLVKGIKTNISNKNIVSLVNNYDNSNAELRVNLKMSSASNSTILQKGDNITLLVKANKKSYLYFAIHGYNMEKSISNILSFSKGTTFIKEIKENDANKWVSLGVWQLPDMVGNYTIQVFATDTKPTLDILPKYAHNNYNILPETSENVVKDLLEKFSYHKGDKYTTSVNYTVIGSKK